MKLNVIVLPVRPKCCTACKSPKPFIASGVAAILGHVAFISSTLKNSLLSLRASNDNFESSLIVLL